MEILDFEMGRHGTTQANLDEMKKLKVKVPLRLLLKLHYAKITESRPIGDVVTDALTQYFQEVLGDMQPADQMDSGASNMTDRHAEAATTS